MGGSGSVCRNLRGNRQRGVKLRITAGGKPLDIIRRIAAPDTVFAEDVDCLVIGDRSFGFIFIAAYQIIAVDVNADSIKVLSVFLFQPDTVILVQDFKVFASEIRRVAVEKAEILTLLCVCLDAVAGGDAYLHTVVGDEIMVASAHDFVRGIIKKIVGIEFQYFMGGKVIIKQLSSDINRVAEIQTVVAEVDKAYPFFKGQGGGGGIAFRGKRGSSQKTQSLLIGGSRFGGVVKAAEADMLAAEGQGGTKVRGAVLFDCAGNALV